MNEILDFSFTKFDPSPPNFETILKKILSKHLLLLFFFSFLKSYWIWANFAFWKRENPQQKKFVSKKNLPRWILLFFCTYPFQFKVFVTMPTKTKLHFVLILNVKRDNTREKTSPLTYVNMGTVEEIASYADIQYRSNAFNWMLSIKLERFWSNAFNRKLSIKRFQSNAFNQTLSIERFQSHAFDQTFWTELFRYILDVCTTGSFFQCDGVHNHKLNKSPLHNQKAF